MAALAQAGDGKNHAEILGELLTRYRVERKLTRAEVADRVGTSTSRISNFERGKEVPDSRAWVRYYKMVAIGLRGYDLEWRAARGEQETPAKAAEDAATADAMAYCVSQDATAGTIIEAAPLSGVETATTFGDALFAARMLDGLSQVDVGELVGVHSTAVNHWEARRTTPVSVNMDKLIELFPGLVRWRSSAQSIPIPQGAGPKRALDLASMPPWLPPTVPPAPTPTSADLATALAMALSQSDLEAQQPLHKEPRHDQWYTTVKPAPVLEVAPVPALVAIAVEVGVVVAPPVTETSLLAQQHSAAVLRKARAKRTLARAEAALLAAQAAIAAAQQEIIVATAEVATLTDALEAAVLDDDGAV